jgi:7-keto-8-aminopelargonate synthetase-like enzyme
MNKLAGRVVTGPASARLVVDDVPYVNFLGAGYFALSNVPEVRRAATLALESGAAFAQHVPPALGAVDPLFASVEAEAARTLGTETSIYFSSGYLIGAIALSCLQRPTDVVFLDEQAHYNLQDAAKQLRVPIHTFSHCDPQSLKHALRVEAGSRAAPVVMTEGTFPTTGAVPPLAEYVQLLDAYGGTLIVDDSHGFGVLGSSGGGAAEYRAIQPNLRTIVGATLSKAYCAHGAVIGCDAATRARALLVPPIRGTSAGSPLSATVAAAALKYIAARPEIRAELHAKAGHFRCGLERSGAKVLESPAPIVTFSLGDAAAMVELEARAFQCGILLYLSNYIGAGKDGLIRCAIFRDHTYEDIEQLLEVIRGF